MTNRARGRQVLAVVLVGAAWVLAVWVARYAMDEWQMSRARAAGLGSPHVAAPNTLVLVLAALVSLAAWWLAYWLRRAPQPWLTASAQWMAAVGVCVIGLVTVQPFSVFSVPRHDVSAFVSMYFQVLGMSGEERLLLIGAALCLPKLVLVVRGHADTTPKAELVGDRVDQW